MKILILFVFLQVLFSCRNEEYCTKEIRSITNITLPEEIEIVECSDNLEYQFIFEYKLNDLSQANAFIENNRLEKQIVDKTNGLMKEINVVNYVGEFFNPNKSYPKNDEIYYVQRDNYAVVFNKSKGVFMGVVEY